jgi:RNA-splicing ligase RtcB
VVKNYMVNKLDIALTDSSSYAARDQLAHALRTLKKIGFDVNYYELLPDTHPGAEIFPDGLYMNLTGEKIIGNFSKDIACGMAFGKVDLDTFPSDEKIIEILKTQKTKLGGGNHFLEIQQVDQLNPKYKHHADKFAIQKNDYIALLHCGADSCGEKLEKWVFKNGEKNLDAYLCDPQDYLPRYQECFDHSLSKRHSIMDALKIKKYCDTVHNQLHNLPDGSTDYFMSANDASQSELMVIPANFGDFTAYVHPTGASKAIPHGTGRIMRRGEAKGISEADLKASNAHLEQIGTKVICPSESRRISEDPRCYRKMKEVVGKLADWGYVEPVFAARPIKTFKV